ncbi:rhomboid family intramembrane serine protease [Reichenbachiella ulvae]|uniref:Rhomboid family intramembrane serine protease n=1 Tax=Reichenbachiella ulvae TaxID=2980104 RepID=A0ABT3CXX6_9BACT|nr:rhomboid family intramembrane serine protease [Reichenbachiella ulvae]MCV9388454.1 rhomboid family intramembrane serine protease [Reichenbachiella ulvae]
MSLTLVLIIITVVISYAAFQNPNLKYKLMFNPVHVADQGQWFRLISSGFVHSNWVHLGFNMFTFYFFGELVERVFIAIKGPVGSVYFIVFYLMAIVISELPSLFKHRHNVHYNSLGASGGVAAMVFCSILFFPTSPICLYGFVCIPGFILGTGYVIYSYMKGKDMSDNVNHNAHLIGALFGIVFTIIMRPTVLMDFVSQISNYSIFN